MSLHDCPICGPLLEAIADAKDYMTLMEIRRGRIPHAKGITDEQRDALQAAVNKREEELSR